MSVPTSRTSPGDVRILVTGATGYIGARLVPRLHERGHHVRCFARAAHRLRGRFADDVEIVEGDIDDVTALRTAFTGCDAAYYLVHSMGSTKEFAEADREAAREFGTAARDADLERIVYLGGLGREADSLSTHLRSRHEVGEILRKSGVPVVEFRAAQIIGSGSISFEMIRYLTERLPVMVAPRWVNTRCQPIGVRDVLAYLVDALSLPPRSAVYEIGGSTVLTYREMMLRYAHARGLRRRIWVVPLFTPRLSSYWVHLITPMPADSLSRSSKDSTMRSSCATTSPRETFPRYIRCLSMRRYGSLSTDRRVPTASRHGSTPLRPTCQKATSPAWKRGC